MNYIVGCASSVVERTVKLVSLVGNLSLIIAHCECLVAVYFI